MASSFVAQIPVIIYVVGQLKPATVLDIGKGFGKYGFLIHEYCGIDPTKKPDPTRTLREQSSIAVDAVDINPEYSFPHLQHFYRDVIIGDVLSLYPTLPKYDLVMMVDIIEHLPKPQALELIRHFLRQGSRILVSTPIDYFQQELYESAAEHHVSWWARRDFAAIDPGVQFQRVDAGGVYLLSPTRTSIRGFGSSPMQKFRRVARAIRSEL